MEKMNKTIEDFEKKLSKFKNRNRCGGTLKKHTGEIKNSNFFINEKDSINLEVICDENIRLSYFEFKSNLRYKNIFSIEELEKIDFNRNHFDNEDFIKTFSLKLDKKEKTKIEIKESFLIKENKLIEETNSLKKERKEHQLLMKQKNKEFEEKVKAFKKNLMKELNFEELNKKEKKFKESLENNKKILQESLEKIYNEKNESTLNFTEVKDFVEHYVSDINNNMNKIIIIR